MLASPASSDGAMRTDYSLKNHLIDCSSPPSGLVDCILFSFVNSYSQLTHHHFGLSSLNSILSIVLHFDSHHCCQSISGDHIITNSYLINNSSSVVLFQELSTSLDNSLAWAASGTALGAQFPSYPTRNLLLVDCYTFLTAVSYFESI